MPKRARRTTGPDGPPDPTAVRTDLASVDAAFDDILGAGPASDPKERKRRRIVAAATELFVRHGYRKTSVDEIARHARVAKGTVYLYFKNKAGLLFHAVGEEKRVYLAKLAPLFDPGIEPRERLRRWIREGMLLATTMPLVNKLNTGDHELLSILEEMDPQMWRKSEAVQTAFFSKLLAEAAAPALLEPKVLSERGKILGAIFHLSLLIGDETVLRGLSVERFAALLADVVVDGIVPANPGGG